MKSVIPEDQVFCAKIQSESQVNRVLPIIHNKLTDQLLKQFKASYFGHLFHIDELKWSNSIVHGLMVRKVTRKAFKEMDGVSFLLGEGVI